MEATKENPTVSVIIPTLNEEFYVGNLLNSLVNQTFNNFEVLVVDGGSEDKTEKVCEKYKEKLPSLSVFNAGYRGVSRQRNFGAKNARADILLFLDADVIIPSDFLEKALNEFAAKKGDMATCMSRPLSDNLFDRFAFVILNAIVKNLRLANGWTIFSKKSLHESLNGFNEKMFYFEDGDYSSRAKKKKTKVFMITATTVYVSVRRFDYEGRLRMLKKMARFFIFSIFKGGLAAQGKIIWETGIFKGIKKRVRLEKWIKSNRFRS